jgi:hypothetical protein
MYMNASKTSVPATDDRPFASDQHQSRYGWYRAKMWNVCVLDDAAKYWLSEFSGPNFSMDRARNATKSRKLGKHEIAKH